MLLALTCGGPLTDASNDLFCEALSYCQTEQSKRRQKPFEKAKRMIGTLCPLRIQPKSLMCSVPSVRYAETVDGSVKATEPEDKMCEPVSVSPTGQRCAGFQTASVTSTNGT